MAAPKVIVSRISTLTPTPHPFSTRPIRVDLGFEDGSAAWLDPLMPAWSQWAFAFSQLRQYQLPIYIEADPGSATILDFEVPVSGRIARLNRAPSGGLRILFQGVFSYFLLRESNPHFAKFAEILRHAFDSGSDVILTRKDEPDEIVDITIPQTPLELAHIRAAVASCVKAPGEIPPVSMVTADAMFALVSETTCDPQAETSTCIPFLFPDYGCEARAHKMCQLMSAAGVTSGKVFNYAPLGDLVKVKTPDAPHCSVSWPGHIAPVLQVTTATRASETYVIDPSLCAGPVALAGWIALQSGSSGHYIVSSQCYEPSPLDLLGAWNTDPAGDLMETTLAQCRAALTKRHPPYHCS